MNYRNILSVALLAMLASCSVPKPTRTTLSYDEAVVSRFVVTNRDAIKKLVANLDIKSFEDSPVLVATVVNVNDLSQAAPLGRTLSEQYASNLAANGLNVKELKLRGDVFIRKETGELLLSREIKDIARSQQASLVLVGTYSSAATLTFITLKLVRTEDSRIISGYDYALPNDADVNWMLQVPR